jgi:hypothetical protein
MQLNAAATLCDWGGVLGAQVVANAILDRLLHHEPSISTSANARTALVRAFLAIAAANATKGIARCL